MRGLILVMAAGCASNADAPAVDAAPSPGDAAEVDAPAGTYQVVTRFGHELIRSVTVHKNGGEDRTVYVERARVAQVPASGPLPDGTRLILDVSGGGGFVIERVAGTWLYGTFSKTADPAVFTVAANSGCAGCHLGAAEPGVFTAPSLRRLVIDQMGEEIVCPQGPGPTPCASSVYQ